MDLTGLKIEKRPDGKINVRGLRIWSTGVFKGYGSPPEGDLFSEEDLDQMVQAHREVGDLVQPRIYPGHPLNPLLKLLARPKGRITNLRREGNYLVADLEGVDPAFWEKAQSDGARLSPDIQFGFKDPRTGKVYPKVIVGLGVLGAAQPANALLPPLDQYAINYYANPGLRSYVYGEGVDMHRYASSEGKGEEPKKDYASRYIDAPSRIPKGQRKKHKDKIPDHVYLRPEDFGYPVKRRKNGEWQYDCEDIQDAITLARMHGHKDVLEKAESLYERYCKGKRANAAPCGCPGEGGGMNELNFEELIQKVEEAIAAENTDLEQVRAYAARIEEQVKSYAAENEKLKQELQRVRSFAEENQRLKDELEKIKSILEAELVDRVMNEIHSFVDARVAEGKLPPRLRDKAVAVLQAAAGLEEDVRGYALGEVPEDYASKNLYGLLMEIFNELEPAKPFQGGVPKNLKKATGTVSGVDLRQYASDPEAAQEFHERVRQYAAEKGVSYAQAFREVLKKVFGEE